MNIRHIANGIRRNWNRPYFYRMRFTEKVVAPLHRRLNAEPGFSVVEEEWDNLFILDACRMDLFSEVIGSTSIEGSLATRYSAGSGSVEYLKSNFSDRDCRDTVYVTANPFVKTEIDTPFHTVDHVWTDGWDDDLGTVRPKTMVERAKAAADNHPDKRLIVHFMQPHYPFIGNETIQSDGLNLLRSKAQNESTKGEEDRDIWARLHNGEVSKDEVWSAYKSNLELVLNSVSELVQEVDGLSVITSDHGNAFGERAWPLPVRVYGHPNGIHINELRSVPWFKCESTSRREITVGGTDEKGPQVDEDIDDRLSALGYK